jgi:geranylgeranyl diphosphate synthase type I
MAIEDEMHQIASTPHGSLAPLSNMMAYHLGWLDQRFQPAQAYSGKRIRSLLCLLACEAAGGEWRNALPAAAALELVHNFSLIHDDIEDNSATRRGRPTVWRLWGLAHGVNVGDAMLMLARLAMGRLRDRGTDPGTILTAMGILDTTCLQLCQGQYLDIACEGHLDIAEEDYLQMIGGKTAALIAASAQLGALIGGAGSRTELYRRFAWHLGLAFQIVDDLLGIWGDPATTGKPAADDIRNRKMTLPIIFALRAGDEGRELVNLYRKESLSNVDVLRAVAILERTEARQYVLKLAAEYEVSALAALDAAEARQPAVECLRALASSLTARQK